MYNFLTVGGEKYGAKSFTIGSGGKIVSVPEALENTNLPLCWAGNYKIALLDHCKKNNLKFYNLDSGYFGNVKRKEYKRVSVNDFQDTGKIIDRPDNRLKLLNLELKEFKRGNSIVIVPPDTKKAYTLQIDLEGWIKNLILKLRQHTDRPIKVRERPAARIDRVSHNTFSDFIQQDTWCVVGYSSNALVESVLCGIPVIPVGPSATKSISNYNIDKIENVSNIDQDLRHKWLCHLSYRQFTEDEMLSGLAWELLNN
jgi:hypothetical protein